MNKDMQEMISKVRKADQDKTKHKTQLDSLKKDIADDDKEGYIAKGKILEHLCKEKNISLEVLCEYMMSVEIHPSGASPRGMRKTDDKERVDTNE